MSVLVAFDLKVSFLSLSFFFSFVWAHFSLAPPPFSSLYFSYSVMSKPSFFKPLPSFNVYFPYFGWKVDGSTVVILATAAAPTALGHVMFLAVVLTDMILIERFMSHWLSFSTTPFDGRAVTGLYATCLLQLILLSSVSSELDCSSEWSYQPWTCCAFIFSFWSPSSCSRW